MWKFPCVVHTSMYASPETLGQSHKRLLTKEMTNFELFPFMPYSHWLFHIFVQKVQPIN